MELSIHLIYDIVTGPLVWVSFIVFFVGTLYQINKFFSLSRTSQAMILANKPPGKSLKDMFSIENIKQNYNLLKLNLSQDRLAVFKVTNILGISPVTTVVTFIFHVCLVFLPIFVFAHNILLDESWGISFFSFSEQLADVLTVVLLICATYFLLRRIFYERVRSITTLYDYLIFIIAVGPFLTGFMAYHQIGNYQLMVLLHILSGELMLIAIPYTKLVHMIYFFLQRCYIGSEYSFGRGSRIW